MTTGNSLNNWLMNYKYNISSQFGEDGIIEKIFEIIPSDKPSWCVEFGAWDGKYMSNVWRIITEKGWSGILIEASQERYKDLLKSYRDYPKAICLNKMVNYDGFDTLDQILAQTSIPTNFDLLSIDIDGNDYHIFESLKNYAPKVILIEFNPSIPPDIEFVQPKDNRVNQGNSLLSLYKLAKAKGYELVATTECNAFFVQKAYFNLFNITDNTPSVMHTDKSSQSQIFQLFDGTLVLSGCKKLLWHNFEIPDKKLQVLPAILRTYPENYNMLQKLALGVIKLFTRILNHK